MTAPTNPFKAFIPFSVLQVAPDWNTDDFDHLVSKDPIGATWRTAGLVDPIKGERLRVDLSGTGYLMAVQFNERILPGKVRDEKLKVKVDKLAAEIGRKVDKKTYAQLRDEVEMDLLPKSHIRRTVVPVLFDKKTNRMLVCTSSQKRCDDIQLIMEDAFGTKALSPMRIMVQGPLGHLTTMAKTGCIWSEDSDDIGVNAGKGAVIKGPDKQTVRIKDKSLAESDVQEILKRDDYMVHEVACSIDNGGDLETQFVVTENLVFKRLSMPGVAPDPEAGQAEDIFSLAHLSLLEIRRVLDIFLAACGGALPRVIEEEKTTIKPFDED